jgi:hypothetical protein
MATDLTRIGEKARREPTLVFSSLYHHIHDVDNLRACFHELKLGKAAGVDKVTKKEYGESLEENLQDLSTRLRRMGYRPGAKRRSYIPKPGSVKGTPQGSILSPLLSNIYLHYALDLWFSRVVRKQCRGGACYFRFADDFLACFQYKDAADKFHNSLGKRLGKFGLQLAEEKTDCIEFGPYARGNARRRGGKPSEFTFLGFTHYCGKTRHGKFKVKHRTNRKKLGQALRQFAEWAKTARNEMRKGDMLRSARRRVMGHLNYYAITDNSVQCARFVHYARRILFKWINRKSQRRTYNWKQFAQALAWVDWSTVRIQKNLCPFQKQEASEW